MSPLNAPTLTPAEIRALPDVEDPLCDIGGNCEPFPEEAHHTQAMCRYCGGWRYRDWPRDGNWGTWEPELEKSWRYAEKLIDT